MTRLTATLRPAATQGDEVLVRLSIDYENPAKSWWEAGGRDLWDALRGGFEEGEVVVDEAVAQSWIAEAARIPGWNDGPEYAPHPIVSRPVEDDTDVRA